MSATECPKCRIGLQDLGTPVPWCDRCAWTPPETDGIAVPLPDPKVEDRLCEEMAMVEPERYEGDADAAYYRRVRLPEQDPEPIRRRAARVGPRHEVGSLVLDRSQARKGAHDRRPKMRAISFAWTTPALLAGEKAVLNA